MLNKLGLNTNPNTASLIAQEMFAQKLRADNMVNPISTYTQYSKESKDKQKLLDVYNSQTKETKQYAVINYHDVSQGQNRGFSNIEALERLKNEK